VSDADILTRDANALMNNNKAFLQDQLTKPSGASKKWRMAIIGLRGIIVLFILGMIMFYIKPDLATQVATVLQFTVTGWSGIIALYIGAQGAVDATTVNGIAKQ